METPTCSTSSGWQQGQPLPKKPLLCKIDCFEIAMEGGKQRLKPTLVKIDSMMNVVRSEAFNTQMSRSDSRQGASSTRSINAEGPIDNSGPLMPKELPNGHQQCEKRKLLTEEWVNAYAKHQRKEAEEWERSFVGSEADVSREGYRREEMEAMIQLHGQSLPCAANLLNSLLGGGGMEQDPLFGT